MITYGQNIKLVDGSIGVQGCATRKEALWKVVDLARHSGWHPRKWWEFGLPKCSDDVRAEYNRQIQKEIHQNILEEI